MFVVCLKILLKLALELNVDLDYLIVLRRMINGYKPKPNNFKESPLFKEELLLKLPYKNTLILYEHIMFLSTRLNLGLIVRCRFIPQDPHLSYISCRFFPQDPHCIEATVSSLFSTRTKNRSKID